MFIKLCASLTLCLFSFSLLSSPVTTPFVKPPSYDVEDLLLQLTLDEKISLVHANSKFTVAGVDRLGIKEMTLSDGPHGIREEISRHSWASAEWDNDFSTYLPPLTAVAASWDPEMAYLHGGVLGREARDRGKDIVLGPGVNLARLPLYGRNFEYLGEDPFLASAMVVPEIKAIQESDVAACVKHYALNTQELERRNVNAQPDERTMREIYLPAFEAAVKQGKVKSVMGAYNQYFGTNANQSKVLVKDILKAEWGFKGVMLTDWHVDINTFDAAMNGLDLEMGTDVSDYNDYFFADPLKKMIKDGVVSMAVLDDKVRRILSLQVDIGMMNKNRKKGERNTKRHRKAAQKIAEQGVVLLKNKNHFLPLNKETLKKVLVMGPNASKKHGRGGGSSQVKSEYEVTPLQGLREALGAQVEVISIQTDVSSTLTVPAEFVTSRSVAGTPGWQLTYFKTKAKNQRIKTEELADATKQWGNGVGKQFVRLSGEIVVESTGLYRFKLDSHSQWVHMSVGDDAIFSADTYGNILEKKVHLNAGEAYPISIDYTGNRYLSLGLETPQQITAQNDSYLHHAKSADAVIFFGGLSHVDDRESVDRVNMKLPSGQDQMIKQLSSMNENLIVFIVGGSAVEMPWVDKVDNILWGWYGGMEAGHAYANVLLGDVNPGAKMPITLPKSLNDTAPIMLDDYNAKDAFYKEGVFIGYRWFEKNKIAPLFPFGHGLSYTQFKYTDLVVSNIFPAQSETIDVTAIVTNSGKVFGSEVVQLYLGDVRASVERPRKELKGFTKVELAPGEQKKVTISLDKRSLSFWSVEKNSWVAEPGKFNIYLGSSHADIRLKGSFVYK